MHSIFKNSTKVNSAKAARIREFYFYPPTRPSFFCDYKEDTNTYASVSLSIRLDRRRSEINSRPYKIHLEAHSLVCKGGHHDLNSESMYNTGALRGV